MQFASTVPLSRLPAPTAWPQEGHEALLYIKQGTQFHPASDEQIIERAQQLVTARMRPDAPILSLPEIHDFLRLKLVPRHRMTFAALLLDRQYRLINYIEMFEGTVDQVHVPLREVIRDVLAHNASVAIFARGEPDGAGDVTDADHKQLERLGAAMDAIAVRLLDYLVVARTVQSVSQHHPMQI
jgi:DNA repair protein RadC